MNDITALAQRMKAAASEITKDTWQLNADEEVVHIDSEGYENFIACTAITDLAQFISIASPANVLALVEALEKAQTENELVRGQLLIAHRTLLNQQQTIAELATGRQNLQRTMGVYVHAYEEAKSHIASLESRTVTVKLPEERFRYGESDYDDGFVNGWNAHGIETRRLLAAAGIQVIEGEG